MFAEADSYQIILSAAHLVIGKVEIDETERPGRAFDLQQIVQVSREI